MVPAFPSVSTTSFTEIAGAGSLSTMVPVACARAMLALVGVPNVMSRVSSASSSMSPMTFTVTLLLVWPGSNVTRSGRRRRNRFPRCRSRSLSHRPRTPSASSPPTASPRR